jgi:poly(3-hydroxybutyrate) depolymerase
MRLLRFARNDERGVIARSRRRRSNLVVLLLALSACGDSTAPESDMVTYNIDPARISVSGLSSGGHMATQLHVAHSSLFSGAAVIAGGPYYCAEGSLNKGFGPCIKGGKVGIDQLLAYAGDMARAGKIDALENLEDDRVWLFHGALDDVVSAELMSAAEEFYAGLMPDTSITTINDIAAVHGLPTIDFGPACDTFSTPFLNACDYDAAGEWLQVIHGELNERTVASGELRSIPQVDAVDADMLDEALLYVPTSCAGGERCGIHVAIHGCTQSSEFVGEAFAIGSGLNEWGESNDLLVLYPQVASSKIAPMNPYGCWDWWGYTNEDYATRSGPQVTVIKNTLDALAGTTL